MTNNNSLTSETLRSVSAKAADLLMRHQWKIWFWGDSIGLDGLLDTSEITGDEKYSGYVYGLMKAWAARIHARNEFDYCIAGTALVRCAVKYSDHNLLEAAKTQAAYLDGFRTTSENAFMRYENAAIELPPEIPGQPDQGAAKEDGGPCVFVDTMHFDGPFYSLLYKATKDIHYREMAVANIVPSTKLLYNPEACLFNHFWMERSQTVNGVLWGRGNGWAMLGIVDTLENLPDDDRHRDFLLHTLVDQAAAIAALQDNSGHWHTVLNDPSSYLETSIAAFMVDGLCRATLHGWLERQAYEPVIESAMAAVIASVKADGKLDGVSYETFPSCDPAHYRTMPTGAVVPWGQGPLMTAIKAYLKWRGEAV